MEENRPLNKYKDGKVYAVRNTVDDTIYVGSTIQPLHKRFFEHKCRVNKGRERTKALYLKMNDLGVDKFYIELIEHVPCCSREELNRREGEIIRENTVCNSNIAGRTKAEYRHETKEKKKDADNKYYISHRQELKQKFKEYYKAHKEDIKHRSKENAFNNKEHREEYIKEYFNKNKDKIEERQNQRIVCSCGLGIRRADKAQHLKTERHQRLMDKLMPSDENINI